VLQAFAELRTAGAPLEGLRLRGSVQAVLQRAHLPSPLELTRLRRQWLASLSSSGSAEAAAALERSAAASARGEELEASLAASFLSFLGSALAS
jgi:hypothetical protein